jgi:hypothetical protein
VSVHLRIVWAPTSPSTLTAPASRAAFAIADIVPAAHVVDDDQHAARDLIAERELALKAAGGGGRALLAFLRRRAFSARWSKSI